MKGRIKEKKRSIERLRDEGKNKRKEEEYREIDR